MWNKTVGNVVYVINIQKSKFSKEDEIDFTLNIGIFHAEIWYKCWVKDVPRFICEEDCFPRFRINMLLNNFSSDASEIWWKLDSLTNTQQLADEIKGLIENQCLPFCDKMKSYDAISTLYHSYNIKISPIEKIYLAIVDYHIHNVGFSKKLLKEVSVISEAWNKRVDIVCSQLNLHID